MVFQQFFTLMARETPSPSWQMPDMEFVKNFTLPDFQAKNFTPSISPNFNSFSKKNNKNE